MNEFISFMGIVLLEVSKEEQVRRNTFVSNWKKNHDNSSKGLSESLDKLKKLGFITMDINMMCPKCGSVFPNVFLPREDVMIRITEKGKEYINKINEANKMLGELNTSG